MGSAFFPNKDNEKISVICKSDAPWIVIDFFSAKDPDHGQRHAFHHSDIDGDRIDDVHHGDLVEALLKVSGKKVISYGLAGTERDVSELVEEDDLTGKIADIIERIKTGDMPTPAALTLSLHWFATLDELHQTFGKDLALTFDNIADKKSEIIARIKQKYGENGSGDKLVDFYYKTHQQFTELEELGVPVVIAAGNLHSKAVNVLSILGGISVGALTPDGGDIAKYSNQSSLTTVYRVGEFKTRRVEGGVDINGDGKADFPTEVLSNDEERIASFRGDSTWGANVKGTSFATPNVCGKDAVPNRLAWLENLTK
jgi:hypothetical protein